MTITQDPIAEAKASFINAKGGMLNAFANTPDDRVSWSPSPSSRTPIEILSHAGWAIHNLHHTMMGSPFTPPTTAEADRGFREQDKAFTTREDVLAHFEQKCTAYEEWLGTLPADDLDKLVVMPFGFGQMPIRAVMGFPAVHTQWHQAQIEYIQTIYGDYDWHIGV